MNAPEILVTTRLEGRRVGPGDEDFARAVFGDGRAAAALGGPRDGERVAQDLARWDAHWREHGFVASRGVMAKLGFVYDCDVEHSGLPHLIYRLDRATWEKTNG